MVVARSCPYSRLEERPLVEEEAAVVSGLEFWFLAVKHPP